MDLDLSGIFQLIFNFFRDISCQDHHIVIGNFFRFYQNPDFTSRLNRIGFFNAAETVRQFFQAFQTFYVTLNILAPCTGLAAEMASAA